MAHPHIYRTLARVSRAFHYGLEGSLMAERSPFIPVAVVIAILIIISHIALLWS